MQVAVSMLTRYTKILCVYVVLNNCKIEFPAGKMYLNAPSSPNKKSKSLQNVGVPTLTLCMQKHIWI